MTRSAVLSVAASFAVFVLVWKAIVVIGGYPPFILPPPESVASRFVRGWIDGVIPPHAWSTLVEIALGLLVGTVVGLVADVRRDHRASPFCSFASTFARRLRSSGDRRQLSPFICDSTRSRSRSAAPLSRRRRKRQTSERRAITSTRQGSELP
jgi:hypothetical protein